MGRPAKYTEDQILDSALAVAAAGDPISTTVAAIAAGLGAPIGSIYHRFASRELLLAHLWIRTVKEFHQGFLTALANEDLDAAADDAALHVVRWSRTHLPKAQLLVLHRREALAARWPAELGPPLARLNTAVESALTDYARRRYGSAGGAEQQRVVFALVDLPAAAVKRHLMNDRPPPSSVDRLVTAASRCVLAAGQSTG